MSVMTMKFIAVCVGKLQNVIFTNIHILCISIYFTKIPLQNFYPKPYYFIITKYIFLKNVENNLLACSKIFLI